MTQSVEAMMAFLKTLTPTNIHLKARPTYGQKVNFESVWNGHGPEAARYYLLTDLYYGRLRHNDS